ncbi:aldose epimerase family protein [Aliiroseovarius subalbicans]|uniref:aldose epimerase family protein n=1 Tax=Aliiroseovarius subalbicans TaxID=2925840 RepID=UPI001F5777FF|nr:aldose epimerase family protein [Aliiroseovarius subalbicans]MCI2398957.1 galactose mutarotase [Aliiroseovarius subalbicans]
MVEVVGIDPEGRPVHGVQIQNGHLRANLLSFGAALQSLYLDGVVHSMVLGYESCQAYFENPNYFGSIVGRYANRIAGATALIEREVWKLDANSLGKHHLHGGSKGSAFRNWAIDDHSRSHVVFSDVLPHGHMGYPGNLRVSARYEITGDGDLDIRIQASTDRPTICNFTSHSYFNLDGRPRIDRHHLQVPSHKYVATDIEGIPLVDAVRQVPKDLDFRNLRPLADQGKIIDLDSNYCLSEARTGLQPAAKLWSPEAGVSLFLSTSEPGLQVYTGAGLVDVDRGERPISPHAGVALEPQIWPDAPNRKNFPVAVLLPEETYQHHSNYRFAVD